MASTTDNIYADIETGPSQDPAIIEHIRAGVEADVGEKYAALEAKKANVKVPGTYKKEESIAAYIEEKRAEIDADIKGAIQSGIEAFDEAWRKTSLDGAFGQVMTCSLGFGNDFPIGLYGEDWQAGDYEARLLQRINEAIEAHTGRHQGQRLIGHNIVGFDRRFLRQRGIIRGVRMHPIFTKEVKPWDSDLVQDTMTMWTGDMRDRIKLDKLCLVLGIDQKGTELDPEDADFTGGPMVWDYIRAGKIAKVSRYCDYDVIRTRAAWHRMMLLPVPAINDPSQAQLELDELPF